MKLRFLSLLVVFQLFLLCTNHLQGSTYSPLYFSFDTRNNGNFVVYVQIKDSLYTMFNITHEVNESQNKNLWRIKDSYFAIKVNNQMIRSNQILTSGENEFVWFSGRQNVIEATGGYHGNERVDIDSTCYVHFYADSVQLNLDENIPLTPCSSFYYEQLSTMHQTGTGGLITSPEYVPVEDYPIECFHEKVSKFNDGGFTTNNKLIWSDNKSVVKRVYYGIFCITRDVSAKGYIDNDEPPNIITFNDNGLFKLKSTNNQRIVMFDETLGKSVVCDSKVLNKNSFKLEASIWDHRIYHKYYSKIENTSMIYPKGGDVWETTAKIKYDILTPFATSAPSLFKEKQIGYKIIGDKLIVDCKGARCFDLMGNSLFNHNLNSSQSLFTIDSKKIYILRSDNNVRKIISI